MMYEIERHKREKAYRRVDNVILWIALFCIGYLSALLVHGL
jgi:hypothetical protein